MERIPTNMRSFLPCFQKPLYQTTVLVRLFKMPSAVLVNSKMAVTSSLKLRTFPLWILCSSLQGKSCHFQMKAGQSKPGSGREGSTIYITVGGSLIFVVSDESIIRRKLAYSGADGGPGQWRHYRLVLLKED
mmetsp:Transcript_17336/g.26261  ORF Transcript_17336/g.26261 Transcript_17336/m.26261 type:complete len:132 (-) Transcript_17336:480-875(-)